MTTDLSLKKILKLNVCAPALKLIEQDLNLTLDIYSVEIVSEEILADHVVVDGNICFIEFLKVIALSDREN